MANFNKNKIIAGAVAVILLGTLGFYFASSAYRSYMTNKSNMTNQTNGAERTETTYTSIEDAPIEERFDNSVVAQRIDENGWYVKFSSGDEIEIPNSYFRSIYNADNTEADVRNKLKAKFKGNNINWDKVFFEFDNKGNLTNVTWEN